jgi:N-acetylglucosaminyldiphosphoundecaprenol N-acetyl-beta-D-mannosaminyltransferase
LNPLFILGCRLDPIDAEDATARILTLAREGNGGHVVTLGTEMVVYAQRDARFRRIVNESALSLCDTVGLLAVARWRGAPLHHRVTGVELMEGLCAGAAATELTVYLLGGAEGVAGEAAGALKNRFPALRVAGTRTGFFEEADADRVAAEVAASGAKLLFVGMGSPRQEFWLSQHLHETGCGAGIGVGGSFDVIAGRMQRAPKLVRQLGLEWLYRLVKEPWRWRRQLALPRFVWLVVLDQLRRSFARS